MADADVDLLERARSGDLTAYPALVELWGDLATKVAGLITGDRVRSAASVRDAFVRAWAELPALHSEHAFRPWIVGKIVEAALSRRAEAMTASPLRAALDAMEPDQMVAAALAGGAQLSAGEIALVRSQNIGRATGLTRRAMKQLKAAMSGADLRAAFAEEMRGVELPGGFYHEAIAPKLSRAPALEARRLTTATAREAWRVIVDPSAPWTATQDLRTRAGSLRAGARTSGRGMIAGVRAARDETLITYEDPGRTLAWWTRSSPLRARGAIEFRWSIELSPEAGGTELIHRLWGVAFPGGLAGKTLTKLYGKAGDSMQASMLEGMERLAALIEERAR